MGIKSAYQEIASYNNMATPGNPATKPVALFGTIALQAAFFSVAGLLAGGLATLPSLDGAEQGDKAASAQMLAYRQKFAAFAETESRLVKLKRVADASEMDALVGDNQSAAKQKFDRTKKLISEEQQKLSSDVFNLSQQMVVDRNIPENSFDDLVLELHKVITIYSLPEFMQHSGSLITPYDTSLRECQVKFAGPDNKTAPANAEAVVDCTRTKTDRYLVGGAEAGAGLTLSWLLALGPLLASRRRRAEEAAKEKPADDTVTTNLKITYTAPKSAQ